MKIFNISLSVIVFIVFFATNINSVAFAETNTAKDSILTNNLSVVENSDTNEIKDDVLTVAEKTDFNSTIEKAREYSIPILVAIFFIAVFCFLLGILVPQLKIAAWSLIGAGAVFFILVNYTEQIVGMFIALIDWFMGMFN